MNDAEKKIIELDRKVAQLSLSNALKNGKSAWSVDVILAKKKLDELDQDPVPSNEEVFNDDLVQIKLIEERWASNKGKPPTDSYDFALLKALKKEVRLLQRAIDDYLF